jgi:hypothetical protein
VSALLPNPGERRRLRLIATRLAHWQPAVITLAIVVQIVQTVTGHTDDLIGVCINIPMITLVVFTFAADYWHIYFMCERCAANTPLDGPGEAHRYRHLLWLVHRAFPLFAGIYIVGATIYFALHVSVLFYAIFAFFAIEAVAQLRHRVLQPWCPRCHWDDGGAEEQVPTTPVPTATADK